MPKISSFLSVFYPENCKSCGDILVRGESLVCLHCELNFGKNIQPNGNCSEIEQLFWGKAEIESAVAIFQFLKKENLQGLIHEFKYKGNVGLALKMGGIVGHNYEFKSDDIDLISFVPMHPRKEKTRGYNQAEKLAEGFSKVTGIKVASILFRVENTTTQTKKDVFDRFENMQNKFEVNHSMVGIRHILLIDDVVTTGATLTACAKKINEKGVKVSLVCLAYRGLGI
ncbi:MAG: hypothetical protein CMP67_07780 [Flavobacteriales bacterium]|nr:hypothetical protein [Flavobacteriales bacterium]